MKDLTLKPLGQLGTCAPCGQTRLLYLIHTPTGPQRLCLRCGAALRSR